MKRLSTAILLIVLSWFSANSCLSQTVEQKETEPLPDWTKMIRVDHPRLFFNQDTWPGVRGRALGEKKEWFDNIKARVDKLRPTLDAEKTPEPRDLGFESAWAAFVFRVTGDRAYLDTAKKALDTSLAYYENCFAEKKAVNWYATSRVHAVLAWDWLFNDLTEPERRQYMTRLVKTLNNVYTAKPPIPRENFGNYKGGFYGVPCCKWFVGCTAFGTGIEEELVRQWLVWGHDENMRLLAHRKEACGDDGGSATATTDYAFYAYPWAENGFLSTWLSATGENIAPDWIHAGYLPNYVIWNWITTDGHPLEHGYGDTGHYTNNLSASALYRYMETVRHLYGATVPEVDAAARYIQQIAPSKKYGKNWFIYPFLLELPDQSPPPFQPERLPNARHFEALGQLFMRSGLGANDTYCLFSCGGKMKMHRHFDALNFVIYHRGHLALDSGTRYNANTRPRPNMDHLINYFCQTVAHNCILVHRLGEPTTGYWGFKAEKHYGGQHQVLGSTVEAFETNDRFVYAAGDATACYLHGKVERGEQADLPEKVSQVTRQIVFLMPNHFVVFDRVTATDPSYKKQWLLHTAHEPMIDGRTFRADHKEGRLFCRTLLPADAVLKPVGGPGREFLTGEKNWQIEAPELKPPQLAMMGQWRVEVSPAAQRATDNFLHLIQVGDNKLESLNGAELIRTDSQAGLKLKIGDHQWQITFNTEGKLGGRIKLSGDSSPLDQPLTEEVLLQAGFYGD